MTRRRIRNALGGLSAAALISGALAPAAQACTAIRLIAADGAAIHARTLEFNVDIQSELMIVPRGYDRVGVTPDGQPGMRWTTKYATLGANGMGQPYMFDAVNEMGLSSGLLYFPGSAGYMAYAPADADRTLAPWQLGSWMLETFASIAEVKAGIGAVVVPETVLDAMGFAPEIHFVLNDPTGASIVVEYVDGALRVHDNALGVLTNSPAFDWHMTNLRNFINLSVEDRPPLQVGSVTLPPIGQGTGMLGMPGDFTPPSRFVRAVAFSQSVFPPDTALAAVLQSFHVLNNFDIPRGSSRDPQKDAHGNVMADYTMWTSAIDLTARRFYFRTYENSAIRSVDLMAADLDAAGIVTISMGGAEAIAPLAP